MTIKQVQCLLSYLNYYTKEIDGIYGYNTKQATIAFQKAYGIDADGIPGETTYKALRHAVCYGMTQVYVDENAAASDQPTQDESESGPFDGIKYFKESEFRCKCSGLCNKDTAVMDHALLVILDKVREHFGVCVTVTSGIRCSQHNANVGGVYNSRHLTGHASDIVVRGFSSSSVLDYVQSLSGVNYSYAIDSSAVHIDTI